MAAQPTARLRKICLALPEAEEKEAWGDPTFRVRDKIFAMEKRGDGRVSIWCKAPEGSQMVLVGADPERFFVPPYVGPKGWLGVNLDKGLSWKRIAVLVREAYERVAPPKLAAKIGKTIEIKPPTAKLSATEIDPMKSKRAQSVLKRLRQIGHRWPDVEDGTQFGAPVLKAGGRTFASAYYNDKRLTLSFWVGVDKQGLLTSDERFSIPKYIGHNGWIQLDVEKSCDWDEIRVLALESYRHFASRKMLAAMEPSATKRTS